MIKIEFASDSDTDYWKDALKRELEVEKEIKAMLVSWREEEGLTTLFDEQLAIILQVQCSQCCEHCVLCCVVLCCVCFVVYSEYCEMFRIACCVLSILAITLIFIVIFIVIYIFVPTCFLHPIFVLTFCNYFYPYPLFIPILTPILILIPSLYQS
jgi:hypothetical protein